MRTTPSRPQPAAPASTATPSAADCAYGAVPGVELRRPRPRPWHCLRRRHGVLAFAALAVALSCARFGRALAAFASRRRTCDFDRPDVAVVGGGAAGSVVAARLAAERPGWCVLVLEAGGPYRGNSHELGAVWTEARVAPPGGDETPSSPLDVPRLWSDVGRVAALHWPIVNGVVARVLGGSGAHNAMLYVRATPRDVEAWNATGWTWPSVEKRYAALERLVGGRNGTSARGFRGPVATRRAPCLASDALAAAWLAACGAAGLRRVDDFNADPTTRYANVAGPYHFNIDERGRRASAYAALLEPALGLANLKVVAGATARRVLVDEHRRAAGVEYAAPGGGVVAAKARRAVVLAAGALNTPRLLLASGLGGPKVGEGLHDHPAVALELELRSDAFWRDPGPLATFFGARGGDSLWASPGTSVGAFLRSSACDPREPADLQLTLFSPGQSEPHVDELGRGVWTARNTALVTVALLRPEARHRVVLDAADPYAPPVIRRGPRNASWYAAPRCEGCRPDTAWVTSADAAALLEGVDFLGTLARTEPLAAAVAFVDAPPERGTDARHAWIRARSLANSHWVGTAAMGDRKDDVVDGDLRLRDEPSVVVADASAIPAIPNGNVHTTVLVVAARAAEALLRIRR